MFHFLSCLSMFLVTGWLEPSVAVITWGAGYFTDRTQVYPIYNNVYHYILQTSSLCLSPIHSRIRVRLNANTLSIILERIKTWSSVPWQYENCTVPTVSEIQRTDELSFPVPHCRASRCDPPIDETDLLAPSQRWELQAQSANPETPRHVVEACQPRHPYNIQSLWELRRNLVHPRGLASKELFIDSQWWVSRRLTPP